MRNFKGYDSRAIANRFVDKAREAGKLAAPKAIPRAAEKKLDIMTLLKFVYMAHGWYLAYADKPLICHPVECWQHGPVIPQVYFAFRPQGMYIRGYAESRPSRPYFVALDDDAQARGIIDFVYKNYSPLSALELSDLTHHERSPWHQTLIFTGTRGRIANDTIKQYYKRYKDDED